MICTAVRSRCAGLVASNVLWTIALLAIGATRVPCTASMYHCALLCGAPGNLWHFWRQFVAATCDGRAHNRHNRPCADAISNFMQGIWEWVEGGHPAGAHRISVHGIQLRAVGAPTHRIGYSGCPLSSPTEKHMHSLHERLMDGPSYTYRGCTSRSVEWQAVCIGVIHCAAMVEAVVISIRQWDRIVTNSRVGDLCIAWHSLLLVERDGIASHPIPPHSI